jgi:hypothetical protein
MDNPETLSTLVTQTPDEDKQNKKQHKRYLMRHIRINKVSVDRIYILI